MSEFDAFAAEVAQEETSRQRQLSEATSLGAATTFEPVSGALPEMPSFKPQPARPSEFAGFADELKEEESAKVSRGLQLAEQHDPESYAKARAIADRDGLMVDFAVANLGALEKRETVSKMRAALEQNPGLREWFKQGDNGAVVKLDELERLSGLPWLLESGGAAFSEGRRQTRLAEIGFAQLHGRSTPEADREAALLEGTARTEFGADDWISGSWTSASQMLPMLFQGAVGGFQGAAVGGAGGAAIGAAGGAMAGGIGAIPGAAAGLTMGATAGAASGAALKAYELEAGLAYREFLGFKDEAGNGLDPNAAKLAAALSGMVNAGLETFSFGTMLATVPALKALGLDEAMKLFGRQGLKEALKRPTFRAAFTAAAGQAVKVGATEITTEMAQEAMTILGGELAKMGSEGDFDYLTPGQWAARVGEAGIETAKAMTIMGPLFAAPGFVKDLGAARRSEKTVAIFTQLNEDLKNDGLRERNPQAFKEAFEASTPESAKTIHVPVERLTELFQSHNVNPQDLQFDDFPGSYAEAMATGGDVEIRLSDYATKLAGTPLGDAMVPHLRMSPEDMTQAEAQAFNEAWQETRTRLMEEDIARLKDETARSAPGEQVFQDVKNKAIAAGRSADVAEQYATVWQAFFSTLAEKTTGRGNTEPGLVLYHGSNSSGLTLDGVEISGRKTKQGKRGRDYGGFYTVDESGLSRAESYAKMAEGTPTIYRVELKPGAKVYEAATNGEVERLSKQRIDELVAQGYAVVRGKDVMGKTVEHAIIDKGAIANLAPHDPAQQTKAPTQQAKTAWDLYQDRGVEIKFAFPEQLSYQSTDDMDLLLDDLRAGKEVAVDREKRKALGPSLFTFLRSKGGLQDSGGELAARDVSGTLLAKGGKGVNLDDAALAAWEAGYFPEFGETRPSIDDLLEAVDRELSGSPVYLNGMTPDAVDLSTEYLGRLDTMSRTLDELGLSVQSLSNEAIRQELEAITNQDAEQGAFFQFAGVQGAVRLDGSEVPALQEAARMQAEGAYPDEIFEATGWFQGVDGAWRFEIADTDATVDLSGFTEGMGLKGTTVQTFAGRLGDVLQHEKLFKAYPALADTEVSLTIGDKEAGAFHPDRSNIEASGPDADKLRSVLLHEVAHAIQEREGFAPGGNLGMGEIYEGEAVESLKSEVQRLEQRSMLAPADDLLTAKQKLVRAAQYEYYRRIAGEVEARNVQERDRLRQAGEDVDTPEWTQDVPNDRQIIIVRTDTHGEAMQSVGAPAPQIEIKEDGDSAIISVDGNVGRLSLRTKDDGVYVGIATVSKARRGEGIAVAMYEKAIEYAEAKGLPLRSDVSVSPQAARVYDALERRGYNVSVHKDAKKYKDGGYTAGTFQGGYVFEIGKAPAEGAKPRSWWRTFFQGRGSDLGGPRADKRGSIQFGTGRTIINLFEKADLSTFLHESGHFFLEVTRDMALREGAPQAMIDDWQQIKDWLGLKDDTVTVDAHEQFARGFEAYLFDGKAPSEALQGAFSRFRAWLTFIYRKITRLNVTVTPEIRAVFDRMLATEEEINAASAVYRSIARTAEEAKQFGVDEAWYAKQQELAREANDQAVSDLQARMLRDVKRETTREWNENKRAVRQEVQDEFARMPVYQVFHYLRTGQALSEDVTVPGARMVLDRAYLVDRYGDSVLSRLPRTVPPIFMDAAKSTRKDVAAVHPDIVAEAFGYESGDALIQDLLSAPPYARALTEEVNLRMRDRFGDLLTEQDRRMDEAVAAVHNDKRGEFLENEMKALYKASQRVLQGQANAEGAGFRLGASLPSRQVASRMARDVIAGKKVADAIRVGYYARQESKAAREAERAISAGDYRKAAVHKQQQLMAHYLAMEARKAKEEVESATRYLNRFGNRKRPAGVDPDYLDQIEGMLERYDLRPSTSLRAIERRKKLADFIAEKEAAGEAIAIPQHLRDEAATVSYKDLIVDDLRAVLDSVKNLEHLGKLKNKLLLNRKAIDFQNAKDELTASAMANVDERKKIEGFNPTRWEKLNLQILSAAATMARIEQVIEWLDGGDINGPWRRILWAPMADAQRREAALHEKVMAPLLAVWDSFPKGYLAESHHFPTIGRSLKKSEIFALALNTGTDSNAQRLLAGERLRAGGGVDTQAKLSEVLDVLTKQDWDAIQTIWDQINSLWPEASALEKRLTGLEPVKVEAREIVNKHGTYKGGYYPLVYDNAQAVDVSARLMSKEDLKMDPQFARIGREAGYLKTRVEEYGEPLSTNLDVITRHIDKVVHDITHWEAVKETNRLIMDPQIATVIRDHLGQAFHDEFKKWLKRIWHGDDLGGTNGFQRLLAKVRSNAGIYALAFRWTTVVTQFAGFGPSAARVGVKPLASAMKQYWLAGPSNPLEGGGRNAVEEFVFSKSSEMRNRATSLNREVRLGLAKVQGESGALAAAQRWGFQGIAMADRWVSVPTWLAGYNAHIEMIPNDEAGAIEAGDRAVRLSQGSGGTKDISSIQADPNFQLLTMFYGPFNVLFNNLWTVSRDFRTAFQTRDMELARSVFFRGVMFVVIPAVMADLLTGRGPDEEDKEEEGRLRAYATWAAAKVALYPLATIPLLRDAASFIGNGFESNPNPASRMLNAGAKVVIEAGKGQDANPRVIAKNTADAAGMALGLPIGAGVTVANNVARHAQEGDLQGWDFLFSRR